MAIGLSISRLASLLPIAKGNKPSAVTSAERYRSTALPNQTISTRTKHCTAIAPFLPQLALNVEQPVVFRDALRAAKRAGLHNASTAPPFETASNTNSRGTLHPPRFATKLEQKSRTTAKATLAVTWFDPCERIQPLRAKETEDEWV
ncbi:MAG: hypothetical protein ABS95_02295 [Verrucomicrobia bacterium SCN 57-15]|nr:MAG: hypothetical protein ABS95_02295 [Verrucomicrobia bacterium SCN 57-15]